MTSKQSQSHHTMTLRSSRTNANELNKKQVRDELQDNVVQKQSAEVGEVSTWETTTQRMRRYPTKAGWKVEDGWLMEACECGCYVVSNERLRKVGAGRCVCVRVCGCLVRNECYCHVSAKKDEEVDTQKAKVDEEVTPLVQVEMFINMLVKKQIAAEKEAIRRVQEATKVEREKERDVIKQQLRDERKSGTGGSD
jgi:hypothetical protein